ncbi:MAG TPA: NfeD family protein [Pirellulales bacterium]|jgi:membrane-bound ClpP family serine protease
MDLLGWAAILLFVGLALAMLEIFVPSGGVLGFLSVTSIIAALFVAFRHSAWSGLGFLGLAVFVVPAGLIVALQVWPKTPMGKRILLPLPTSEDVLPHDQRLLELKKLVGRIGRAKSLMLPSGAIDVDGKTFDALSEGMAIEAGQWVKVVEVRGSRVVVRPTDRRLAPEGEAEQLNRPIDELGLDPFDENT